MNKQSEDAIKISQEKIQVFKLTKNVLIEAVDEFPEFRRWLFYRASCRRIHWRKVFEENRNQFLTKIKIHNQKLLNLSNGYKNKNLFLDFDQSDMLGHKEEEETIGILLRKRAKIKRDRGPEIEAIDE